MPTLPLSAEEFQRAIQKLLDGKLTAIEIAETCGVAVTTVDRWSRGVTGPAPSIRAKLLGWLDEKVQTKHK